jgi:hypothetical protein
MRSKGKPIERWGRKASGLTVAQQGAANASGAAGQAAVISMRNGRSGIGTPAS